MLLTWSQRDIRRTRCRCSVFVAVVLCTASCSGGDSEQTLVPHPVPEVETEDGSRFVADQRWGDGRAIGVAVNDGYTAVVTTTGVFVAPDGEELEQIGPFSGRAANVEIELLSDGAGVVLAQADMVWTIDPATGAVSEYSLAPGTAVRGTFETHGRPMVATSAGVLEITNGGLEPMDPNVVPAGDVGATRTLFLVPVAGTADVVIDDGRDVRRATLSLADGDTVRDVRVSTGGDMAVSSSPQGDPFEREDRINVLTGDGTSVRAVIEIGGPLEPSAWTMTDEHVAVVVGEELRVWSLDGEKTAIADIPTDRPIQSTVQMAGGVLTVHSDGTIIEWPSDTWVPEVLSPGGTTHVDVDVSPDGSTLALVDFFGRVVRRSGVGAGQVVELSQFEVGEMTDVAIAPDGRLAVSSSLGNITVLDDRLRPLAEFRTGAERLRVGVVDFNLDGSFVVAGVAQRAGDIAFDDTVVAWRETGTELFRRDGAEEDVAGCGIFNSRISFSPDGRRMAVSSHDFSVDVFDTATGEVVTVVTGPSSILDLAFLPGDGRLVVAYDNATVSVRDGADFTEVGGFQTKLGGYSAVAPLGTSGLMAVADVTGNVEVVRVDDGVPVDQLGSTGAQTSSLAASADGSFVAAPASDGQIVVWSTAESREISRLSGHTGVVTGLAFATDTRLLASTSRDGTLRTWALESM